MDDLIIAPVEYSEPPPEPPTISDLLYQEVVNAEGWPFKAELTRLYEWYERFNLTFFANEPLPKPILGFARIKNKGTLADYNISRNELGLRNAIRFNDKHINAADGTWVYGQWAELETLLHEMTHAWQQTYGLHQLSPSSIANGYAHNAEFVSKCASFGLFVRKPRGSHYRVAGGWFAEIMAEYGIAPPEDVPTEESERENYWMLGKGWTQPSKTQKWQCPCGQIIRVTDAEFPGALCAACGLAYANITIVTSRESEDERNNSEDADLD